MKKYLLLIAMLNVSHIASAYTLPSSEQLKMLENTKIAIDERDNSCKTIYKIAESVMRERQQGITLQYQLSTIERDQHSFPDSLDGERKKLVEKAYTFPRFSKKIDQSRITKEYSLKAFLECRQHSQND